MRFHLSDVYDIFGTPTYFEGEGGGGGGGGTGEGGNQPPEKKEEPPATETVPKAEMERIVQQRVEETRRKAAEDLAKDLGMPIEDVKKFLQERQEAEDKEKSEAQLAREKADREKAEAETEKAEAAKVKHDANVERVIIRELPRDLKDEDLAKKVERISSLIKVDLGADADVISTAVKDLKKDEPSLFGEVAGGKKLPPSDPSGRPPKGGSSSEDGFTKGQERAKAQASTGRRSMLVENGS